MSKICRDFTETVKTWSVIEIEDNEVFLVLDSLEYKCIGCDKSQYADLSIVPPNTIKVKCSSCGKNLVTLREDDFRTQLVPIDEIYDYVDANIISLD